jgi:hypothetical protein
MSLPVALPLAWTGVHQTTCKGTRSGPSRALTLSLVRSSL